MFSLRRWRVEHRARTSGRPSDRAVRDLLRDPPRLLVTILLGNELVNVAASNLGAMIERQALGGLSGLWIVVGIFAMTLLLLILGEVAPKTVAITQPEAMSRIQGRPLRLFTRLIAPVRWPFERVVRAVNPASRAHGHELLTEDDFVELLGEAVREETISQGEAEMIEEVFRLKDTPVRALMTGRPDMVALPLTATLEEAIRLTVESHHSRIPVYGEDLDDVRGVVYAMELLAWRFGQLPAESLEELVRPVPFVPETKRVRALLEEFRKVNVQIAIVLDEFGGTAGLATMEDLLEQIVGELEDVHDAEDDLQVRAVPGGWRVSGRTPLVDFNRQAPHDIEDPDVDTVGGYVMKLLERVPAGGEQAEDPWYRFSVARVEGTKIVEILVEPLGGPGPGPEEAS
jgi:putative hemolysin